MSGNPYLSDMPQSNRSCVPTFLNLSLASRAMALDAGTYLDRWLSHQAYSSPTMTQGLVVLRPFRSDRQFRADLEAAHRSQRRFGAEATV